MNKQDLDVSNEDKNETLSLNNSQLNIKDELKQTQESQDPNFIQDSIPISEELKQEGKILTQRDLILQLSHSNMEIKRDLDEQIETMDKISNNLIKITELLKAYTIENAVKQQKDEDDIKDVYNRCKKKYKEINNMIEQLLSHNFNWDHDRIRKMISKSLQRTMEATYEQQEIMIFKFEKVGAYKEFLENCN